MASCVLWFSHGVERLGCSWRIYLVMQSESKSSKRGSENSNQKHLCICVQSKLVSVHQTRCSSSYCGLLASNTIFFWKIQTILCIYPDNLLSCHQNWKHFCGDEMDKNKRTKIRRSIMKKIFCSISSVLLHTYKIWQLNYFLTLTTWNW